MLEWYAHSGRHDLPWQQNQSAYHVWVSEIMLQQTQVVKVIDYFQRFIDRFPDLKTLAASKEDDVLQMWSGLGYYSRARNLRKAAQVSWSKWQALPDNTDQLKSLPGIGQSTAAAILSLAYQQRAVILDGNVKRVLSRYFLVDQPLQTAQAQQKLWQLADQMMPDHQPREYTQAIMDLGATICKPKKKAMCNSCPLISACKAFEQNRVAELPLPKKALKRPLRKKAYRLTIKGHQVLLVKRPAVGVWGGLWCLPEREICSDADSENLLTTVKHVFSHFELEMSVFRDHVVESRQISEPGKTTWFDLNCESDWPGMPAPIKKILIKVRENEL